jgi:hypothetical protein
MIASGLAQDSFTQCQAFRIGGSNNENPTSFGFDDSGNYFVAGQFSGTVDFNPGSDSLKLTSVGGYDAFLCKFNSIGSLIWTVSMGGKGADCITSIYIDVNNNIYLTGRYQDTCDLDPNPFSSVKLIAKGNNDIFVIKLDNKGQLKWAKSLGGPDTDVSYRVLVDRKGNVFTAGAFYGTADFDPGNGTASFTSKGLADGFISKLDSNGNYSWLIQIGGASMDFPTDMTFDKNDNILCSGPFGSTVDFDPDNTKTVNLTTAGYQDIFLCKYNSRRDLIWAKRIGGKKGDQSNAITTDIKSNIIFTGSFADTVDFDPGSGVQNLIQKTGNFFVTKLDSNGNYIWAKQLGGDLGGYGENATPGNILTDDSASILTFGSFVLGGDFDPGPSIYSMYSKNLNNGFDKGADLFLSKLSSKGDFVYAKQIGGVELESLGDLGISKKGEILMSGSCRGSGDYDPEYGTYNLTSAGLADIFVVKYTREAAPVISASGPLIFCQGDSLKLTSSILKNNLWSTKDTTRSIWVKKTGNYTATVESGTCNRFSNSIKTTLLNRPAVPTITANRTDFCKGDSAILTSSYISGNLWSTGETSRTISVTQSGSYTVSYSDANNCKSTSLAKNITANDTPSTPIISANGPTTFCDGGKVTITSSQLFGNTWSDGDTNRSRIIDFSQQLSVKTTRGKCSKTSSTTKIVVVSYPSVPFITASGNSEFCVGDSVKLISSANSDNKWSTGETTKEIVVKKTGKYLVSVSNGYCSSTSDTFLTNTNPFPTFTKNPSNISVNQGGSAVFEVNTSASNPIYQWQIYQSANYQNLVNNAQYSGVGTSKLTISNVTLANNNTKFRCLVTDNKCSSTSAMAALSVNAISSGTYNTNSFHFIVFPNPTQGLIYIDSKININLTEYIVHDMSGRFVKHSKIERDRSFGLVNISELPAGLYQIKFGASFQYFARIVKD